MKKLFLLNIIELEQELLKNYTQVHLQMHFLIQLQLVNVAYEVL